MGAGRRARHQAARQDLDEYTSNPAPYGLRDPAIDEKRVRFICNVDRIATFGKP